MTYFLILATAVCAYERIRHAVRSDRGEPKVTVPHCQVLGNDDGRLRVSNVKSLHAVKVMKAEPDALSVLAYKDMIIVEVIRKS